MTKRNKEKSSQTPFYGRLAGFLFGKTAFQGTFGHEKYIWSGAGGRLGGFLLREGYCFGTWLADWRVSL